MLQNQQFHKIASHIWSRTGSHVVPNVTKTQKQKVTKL